MQTGESFAWIFYAGLFTLIGLLVCGYILLVGVIGILRTKHRPVWQSLGAPSVSGRRIFSSQLLLHRFIWKRQYRSLADKGLTWQCRALVLIYIAYCLVFCGALIAYFIGYRSIHY